jgi:hypothetical protein
VVLVGLHKQRRLTPPGVEDQSADPSLGDQKVTDASPDLIRIGEIKSHGLGRHVVGRELPGERFSPIP